jgi:hypothetical protein
MEGIENPEVGYSVKSEQFADPNFDIQDLLYLD